MGETECRTRWPVCLVGAVCTLAAAGAGQSGPSSSVQRVDSSWLAVDTVTRTAEFNLIAGFTGLNGALNFNGFRDGGLTLAVPLNWHVVIRFSNHDGMLPHSAAVIPDGPVPTTGAIAAAFSQAVTLKLQEGLTFSEQDDLKFVANKSGSYLIVCGVPGHAAAGMWIRFKVDPDARAPSLVATPGGS